MNSKLLLIFFFLFLLILWAVWKMFKTSSNGKLLNLPPGPPKFPIIGNLPQLNGALPHHKLRDLAKKYGPVMQLKIGEVPTVIVSSPETAKQVLQTHDAIFAYRPTLMVADIMFYKAADIIFAPCGDYWKQLRKICMLELFNSKRVELFRPIREEEVANLIKSISCSARSPINLSKMVRSLPSTITARAAFGSKCLLYQEEFIQITKEILDIMAGFGLADLFPSIKLLSTITGVRYRLKKLHKRVDFVLEKIIDGHRISRDESNISIEDEDIVHVFLKLQEQGNLEFPLTTDSIKAVILDIFVGGTDTSAALTEWAMSELMKNPKAMRKAQAEVRQIFDRKTSGDETINEELKYLKLLIKETLRLHPPAPFLVLREARKQCQLNGYDIPAKTRVIVNAFALGSDPNYWFEPEKFIPERFIDNPIDYKGGNFEFLPFGSGRRICPGSLFGMANVELALAHLLYQFDWELPDSKTKEDLDMAEDFGTVTRRKNDLYLIPIPYRQLPSDHGSPN
ncbi:cytochrome P450 71D11-like [Mercurialis annua]|uniref:cytochrome P450 71D11-like n=1 Tax=Mercurialis annua TaxID=3986 RepID=UPI00215FCDD5|nr:cytochrome P450 71D11-like [Mercurialis annua]